MKRRIKQSILLLFAIFLLTGCKGKSASFYYKEGNKLMEKGDYEAATIHFLQAVEKNPERAEYYIASGFSLIGEEKFEEALNQFDKGYSEKDNQVVRENNKALYRGKGIAKLRLGKYEEAKEEFLKALSLKEYHELDADIKKYIALIEIKLGNYPEAIQLYEDLQKIEKPDAESFFRLARAYQQIGDLEKAEKSFDEGIALDRDNFNAYFGKYELYMDEGLEDKAKEALESAAGIKVTDDTGVFNRGILEFLRGNYDKATVDFEVAYDKNIKEASYYLGRIASLKKDYQTAKVFYQRFQAETNLIIMSGWYDGMALCEMKEGHFEEALQYVKKGLTLEDLSYTKSLYLKKIAIEEELNHYPEAYDTTLEYLKLFPNDERIKKESLFLKSRLRKKKAEK